MRKKNYELETELDEWKDKEDQHLRELNYPEDKNVTYRPSRRTGRTLDVSRRSACIVNTTYSNSISMDRLTLVGLYSS